METVRIVLTIAEGMACLGCFALAASLLLKKRKNKIPCETCGNLRVKNRRRRKSYRYLCCLKLSGFNNPPLYCDKYRKREDGREEEE